MATEVNLPELGESVTEGTVTQWLKSVGDEVAVDEPLLEISTDKVDTEIPSPVAGTLLEIKVEVDETVNVGAVLAVVGDSDESSGSDSSDDSSSEGESAGEQQSSDEGGSDRESSDEGDSDEGGSAGGDEGDSGETASDEEGSGSDDGGSDGEQSDTTEQSDTVQSDTEQSDQPSEEPESSQTDEGATDAPPSEQESAAKADASPASGDEGATEVKLPALGESVTEGTVTQWLKSVGDEVAVDEPLLEVSTDKVDTEIPSPVAGTLTEIVVEADETVEVGAVLAKIGSGSSGSGGDDTSSSAEEAGDSESDAEATETQTSEPSGDDAGSADGASGDEDKPDAGESGDGADSAAEQGSAEAQQATPEPSRQDADDSSASTDEKQEASSEDEKATASSGGDDGSRSYVTPLVRKLATQHGVDLASLVGTGVGGRIRKQDVLKAAEKAKQEKEAASAPAAQAASAEQPSPTTAAGADQPEPSPLRGKTEKLSRLRKVIAARMVESLQVSAQLTTVVEVDVTAISRLRERVKADFEAREGVKLSFLPFFAKAAIDALKSYPQVNASIDTEAGEVTYHPAEHLGVAVDTERGLLVPVIKDAGDLSIAGLSRKIADLAARTRDNKVTPDELSGGTFTLTNTGSRGALFDTPIINQPQVAILGTGTVVKRAVVISDANLGETIAIRRMVYLALTYDHRLVDGADAARFLTAIKQRLEQANFEAELGL